MKASEIQVKHLVEFSRIDEEEEILKSILESAKAYVRAYTGLDDTAIDMHEDITHAIFVICEDMYDNRSLYVEKSNINKVVDSILGIHCVNLL